MEKHKNLSIFIPHEGCKNQCSFCDQRSISGAQRLPTKETVAELCSKFLPKDKGDDYEIAFFGGSFTAIEPQYMLELLQAAYPFVQQNRASGIRISTRPDAINAQVLDILKEYGVTSIELGAQSMQNDVLGCNLRGHTQEDVVKASKMIQEKGFSLGLQMMVGMYAQKDYTASALDTAQKFVALHPDTVRIYPTLTLENTLLEKLYKSGEYTPPTLEETVEICATLIELFKKNHIRIIKLGLHSDEGMEKKIVAGPYHPAFKELCLSKIFLEKVKQELTFNNLKNCIIKVNTRQLSQFKGQKNSNVYALEQLGYRVTIVPDKDIKIDNFEIETIKIVRNNKCI